MLDSNLLIIIIVIVSLIFGFLFGILLGRIKSKRQNKKEIEDAQKVLSGERDNFIEIDGVKYDATKFRLEGEDGTEIVINLKGGYKKIEDAKENLKKERKKLENHPPIPQKNSNSIREKKRVVGTSNRRRIRRFG